jgi:hypothetical protein
MDPIVILSIVTGGLIWIYIQYLMVRSAVKDAMKQSINELHTQMKIQNNLKILEFEKQGIPWEEVELSVKKSFN